MLHTQQTISKQRYWHESYYGTTDAHENLCMQIREYSGYHVRKDDHCSSAVNLDHHNMKATNQYLPY